MVRTDKSSDTRQATIAIGKQLRTIITLSIHTHRAEFIQHKGLPLIANALLTIYNIPLGLFALNHKSNERNQGRETPRETRANVKSKVRLMTRSILFIVYKSVEFNRSE